VVPMLVNFVALWGIGLGGGYWLAFEGDAPMGVLGFWIGGIIGVAIAGTAIVSYFLAVSRPMKGTSRRFVDPCAPPCSRFLLPPLPPMGERPSPGARHPAGTA